MAHGTWIMGPWQFLGEDPFSLIATWEGTQFGSDSGVKERGSVEATRSPLLVGPVTRIG